MAYTNSTTNYNLPQYIGTDKPTYLSDFNGAMSAIDAQMKINADNASSASSSASSASSVANNALSVANGADTKADTAITNAGTAQTTADTAQSVATSALSTANTANGKADTNASNITSLDGRMTSAESDINSLENDINKFNLTNFTEITSSNISINGGNASIGSTSKFYVATNTDGSIAKIYGRATVNVSSGTVNYIYFQTSLRPESDIVVNTGALQTGNSGTYGTDFTITTTGEFRITMNSTETRRVMSFPCLYFIKSFGDTPTSNE